MEKLPSAFLSVSCLKLVVFFMFSLVDMKVLGRAVRPTRNELCQFIPSPTELSNVPTNVPLENSSYAPFFMFRQRLELVDYIPHKAVLVSMLEDPSPRHPVRLYIPEAKFAASQDPATGTNIITTEAHNSRIGRFKSPSSDVELRRCGDVDVHLVSSLGDDEDQGITLEWHPPDHDVGPVDIYITRINFKRFSHRRRSGRRQP